MAIVKPRGEHLDSCPWALLRSPGVQDAMRLHGWRKDGCLDPMALTCTERRAVEAFSAGVSDQLDEHMESIRRKGEADAARRKKS